MGALSSMNIFLRQEIDRMQRVITLVRITLHDLKLAIEGTIIMSEVCSNVLIIFNSVVIVFHRISVMLWIQCMMPKFLKYGVRYTHSRIQVEMIMECPNNFRYLGSHQPLDFGSQNCWRETLSSPAGYSQPVQMYSG